MGVLFKFGSAALLTLVSALLNGWVLVKLWGWFIVPTFNVEPLTLVPAIGLALVVGFLTTHYFDSPKEGEDWLDFFFRQAHHAIFHPIFSFVLGWVLHQFM